VAASPGSSSSSKAERPLWEVHVTDSGYRVFLVSLPVNIEGEPVDVEDDAEARRVLHERIDRLRPRRLEACAAAAVEGGAAAPGGDRAEWARRLLHEAVDEVFGMYNRYVDHLCLDGETLVASGETLSEMQDDPTYSWVGALSASGITDEPLPGAHPPSGWYSAAQLHDVSPIAAWFHGHVRAALEEVGVDPASPGGCRLLDGIEERKGFEPVVALIAAEESG
jgi:hypothetical protein